MEFRKLYASEIDARVSTVNAKGLSLLLYKDARVDQRLLDETVGPMNWQRSHQLIGDRLYCTVSVRDGGDWVSKQDVGTESYTEAEKGQASDSFKRACFNWGIGRELYSAPFIWVSADRCNLYEKGKDKWVCNDRFIVKDIGYDDSGNICSLVIVNKSKGNDPVFTYEVNKGNSPEKAPEPKQTQPAKKSPPRMITDTQVASIYNNAKLKGVSVSSLLKFYNVKNIKELSFYSAEDAIKRLMAYPDKATNENAR